MSKLQYNEEIHCPRCNAVNKKSAIFCEICKKKIHANYKPFNMFLKKHTKDELSQKVTDKIFEAIKAFLLSHIYGVAITVAIVTSAVSAVAAYPSYVENLSQEEAIEQGLIEVPGEAPTPDTPPQPPEPEPEPVDPELVPGGLAVDTKIFDLFSMNKSQVEAIYGTGEFNTEFALMNYDNGISVSYGSHFIENIHENSQVYAIDIPLSVLLPDCPSSLTFEDLKKTFKHAELGFSEMDQINIITINYQDKMMWLYPDFGLGPNTFISIKKSEDW